MFWGLLVAILAAFFAHTRGGLFDYGFTDPKIILMTMGVIAAWYWREGEIKTPKLFIAALAYCASIVPSLIASKSFIMSMFGYPGVYSGSVLTTGLCSSGVVLANRLKDDQKRTLRKVILASGTLLAILLVAQAMHRDPLRWPLPGNKAPGIHGSAIDSGALMVSLLSVSPNPIFLVGIWATKIRGAWLGAIVALVPVRFRAAAFVFATVIGILYTFNVHGPSDKERASIWVRAATHVSAIGSGPATFSMIGGDAINGTTTASAHNSVLEAAATKGLFGLLGLMALLVAPEMAGLWTVAMFNPISFEVVFIACVLVGIGRFKEAPCLSLGY